VYTYNSNSPNTFTNQIAIFDNPANGGSLLTLPVNPNIQLRSIWTNSSNPSNNQQLLAMYYQGASVWQSGMSGGEGFTVIQSIDNSNTIDSYIAVSPGYVVFGTKLGSSGGGTTNVIFTTSTNATGIQINGTNITIPGSVKDSLSSTGTTGQVLTSTGTATKWANTFPTSLTASSITSTFFVINCGSVSANIFNITMTTNITGLNITNPVIGGQYTVYITGGASNYTISSTLTSGSSKNVKTNFTSPVTITATTGRGLMTFTYDGSYYYVACTAYN